MITYSNWKHVTGELLTRVRDADGIVEVAMLAELDSYLAAGGIIEETDLVVIPKVVPSMEELQAKLNVIQAHIALLSEGQNLQLNVGK